MFVMGHGGNTIPRIPDAVKVVEKLDLLVVVDPYPTSFASMSPRQDHMYLLQACPSLEMAGSRTASNRSLQWSEQPLTPIFESQTEYELIYLLSKTLVFAATLFTRSEDRRGGKDGARMGRSGVRPI